MGQIVWDEKKNRWVDVNEPEEEVRWAWGVRCFWTLRPVARPGSGLMSTFLKLRLPLQKKAAPPPPMSLPKAPQTAAPGPGGPPRASVNMFSRKAGNRVKPEISVSLHNLFALQTYPSSVTTALVLAGSGSHAEGPVV